eukprot:TRINITY_DN47292_c0_g1_i1.p1 TRINITY_DN47292_c0_g1~~TRINITY_DN47292_c0_g1_i1.p1  ORF type:complete len:514 (+),score=72.50 TRINITY_DN47292_c0_g1_i1:89-1543(+)
MYFAPAGMVLAPAFPGAPVTVPQQLYQPTGVQPQYVASPGPAVVQIPQQYTLVPFGAVAQSVGTQALVAPAPAAAQPGTPGQFYVQMPAMMSTQPPVASAADSCEAPPRDEVILFVGQGCHPGYKAAKVALHMIQFDAHQISQVRQRGRIAWCREDSCGSGRGCRRQENAALGNCRFAHVKPEFHEEVWTRLNTYTVQLSACVHPCVDRVVEVPLTWLSFKTQVAQEHAERTRTPSWCVHDRSITPEVTDGCTAPDCRFAHVEHPEHRKEVLRKLQQIGVARGRGPVPDRDKTVLVIGSLLAEDVQAVLHLAKRFGHPVRCETAGRSPQSAAGIRVEFAERAAAERMIQAQDIVLPSGRRGACSWSQGPINETAHTVYYPPQGAAGGNEDEHSGWGPAVSSPASPAGQPWQEELQSYLTARRVPARRAGEITEALEAAGCCGIESIRELAAVQGGFEAALDSALRLKPLEEHKLRTFLDSVGTA